MDRVVGAVPTAERGVSRECAAPHAVRARLAVEAGCTSGWHEWVGLDGRVLGVDRFGASAPGGTVMREYGFTVDNVVARALALLEPPVPPKLGA